jgi:ketosteroid isomerase-like protein
MTGTVAQPLEVDDEKVGATGARVEVDCIDVIEVRDGLIARKDTYLDALTMQQQLESA